MASPAFAMRGCAPFASMRASPSTKSSVPAGGLSCASAHEKASIPATNAETAPKCPPKPLWELAGEDTGIAAVGPVGRGPVHHHHDAVAEVDEEVDVRDEPQDPGDEAGEMHLAHHHDRGSPADRRELAVVPIAKRLRGLSLQRKKDVPGGMAAHLLCRRSNARNRFVAAHDGGEVADHVELRVAGNREVRLDEHPARAIDRRAERPAEGRARYA